MHGSCHENRRSRSFSITNPSQAKESSSTSYSTSKQLAHPCLAIAPSGGRSWRCLPRHSSERRQVPVNTRACFREFISSQHARVAFDNGCDCTQLCRPNLSQKLF